MTHHHRLRTAERRVLFVGLHNLYCCPLDFASQVGTKAQGRYRYAHEHQPEFLGEGCSCGERGLRYQGVEYVPTAREVEAVRAHFEKRVAAHAERRAA